MKNAFRAEEPLDPRRDWPTLPGVQSIAEERGNHYGIGVEVMLNFENALEKSGPLIF